MGNSKNMMSHSHTPMKAVISIILICCSCMSSSAVFGLDDYCKSPDYRENDDLYDFCLVAKCLDKTGGGFHSLSNGMIWDGGTSNGFVQQFGTIKNYHTDRPYSRDYLDCYTTRGGGGTDKEKKLDVFYKGITKIWECLKNDDAACLARYTDKINLRSTDFLLTCRNLATYEPGISSPDGPYLKNHVAPHLIFDNPLNFYKCIIENKSEKDTYDQKKPETFEITDYHFLKRILNSPVILIANNTSDFKDKRVYFILFDAVNSEFGNSIVLSYNPSQTDPDLMINLDFENPLIRLRDFHPPHQCNGCEKKDYDAYQTYLRNKSLKDQFYDPKYPDCHLGSYASLAIQSKCHVSYCFDHSGGGYDVFDHSGQTLVTSFEKPYTKEYMTCTYPREEAYDDFTKEMRYRLYMDLEKLWECSKKKDLSCVEKMTSFKSNCGDDKWRIQSAIFPKECEGLGKSYKEVVYSTGEITRAVNAHQTLTKEEYFQCMQRVTNKMAIGFSSEDLFKYIRSPYIVNKVVKKDPSEKGQHEVEFILSTDIRSDSGIWLRYGTPANPTGFAISQLGFQHVIGKAEDVLEAEKKEDEARSK